MGLIKVDNIYLSLVEVFEQWLETNYLPSLAQLIVYKLLKIFRKARWSEWVTVDNQRLMAETGIKREATFIEIRDKLIQTNLFFYKKGKKGCPNQYKINKEILYYDLYFQNSSIKRSKNSSINRNIKRSTNRRHIR